MTHPMSQSALLTDEELSARRDHPPHLAKLTCGHLERFVLLPIRGWAEWCTTCHDYRIVVEGV